MDAAGKVRVRREVKAASGWTSALFTELRHESRTVPLAGGGTEVRQLLTAVQEYGNVDPASGLAAPSAARTTALTYSADNKHLISIVDAGSRLWRFEYDTSGRMVRLIDPLGHITTNTYASDATLGERISRQDLPSGSSLFMTYDLDRNNNGMPETRVERYRPETQSSQRTDWRVDEFEGFVPPPTYTNGQLTNAGGVGMQPLVTAEWRCRYDSDSASTPTCNVGQLFNYAANGRLREVIQVPQNYRTEYVYDNALPSDVIEVRRYNNAPTNATFDATQLRYNAQGRVTCTRTPTGAGSRVDVYGTQGQPQCTWAGSLSSCPSGATCTTTPTGMSLARRIDYQTNPAGQLTVITAPDGMRTTLSYDAFALLDRVTADEGTGKLNLIEDFDYDFRGFLTRHSDRRGVVTRYDYATAISRLGMPSDIYFNDTALYATPTVRTTFTHDAIGNITSIRRNNGGVNATTNLVWLPVGTEAGFAPSRITDATGFVSEFTYNAFGQLLQRRELGLTDQAGASYTRISDYAYSAEGWPTEVRLDNVRQVLRSYTNGLLTAIEDGRGVRQTFSYDGAGRLAARTDGAAAVAGDPAVNGTWTYSYRGDDLLASIGGPNSLSLTYAYDGLGRVVTATRPNGNRNSGVFDDGTVTSLPSTKRGFVVRSVLGENSVNDSLTTDFQYDAIGRVTRAIRDPAILGGTRLDLKTDNRYSVSAGTDVSDRVSLREVVDPAGNVTRYSYNAYGAVREIVEPSGKVWTYTYDALNRLVSMRDPSANSGRDTTYTYDLEGRRLSLTRAGKTERWTYWPDGRVRSHTAWGGTAGNACDDTQYRYDRRGRLVLIEYPTGCNGRVAAADVTLNYDNANNLISGVSGGLTASLAYDALNRVKQYTSVGTRTLNYGYTAASQLSSVSATDYGTVSYAYNSSGQLTSLTPFGQSAQSFTYAAHGAVSSHIRPSVPSVTTTWLYDRAGRVIDQNTTRNNSAHHNFGYPVYDPRGLVRRIAETWPGQTALNTDYSYDTRGRMATQLYPATGAATLVNQNLSFDDVGNWLSTTTNTSAIAPTITTQPSNSTAAPGGSTTFSVVVTGTAPLSYQWRFNSTNISGATSASYTISNVQSANAGSYTVVVSNSAGSVTSSAATLTVTSAPATTLIEAESGTRTGQTEVIADPAASGGNAVRNVNLPGDSLQVNYSASSAGTGSLVIRFGNGDPGGTRLLSLYVNNVKRQQLSFPSTGSFTTYTDSTAISIPLNAGTNTIRIQHDSGDTNGARLDRFSVSAGGAATAPSISTQPTNRTVAAGSSTTFSVVAAGTAPLSYQWRFNGTDISGATAASYTISNVQSGNAGSYSVVVSNSAGSVTSNVATLSVTVTTLIEAESGTRTGQAAVIADAAASGGNAVRNIIVPGDSLQVSYSASSAGSGTLVIRFGNGDPGGTRLLSLYVNNVKRQQLSFPSTGSFSTYADSAAISIPLNAGSNTIRIQHDSGDTNSARLDRFSVTR